MTVLEELRTTPDQLAFITPCSLEGKAALSKLDADLQSQGLLGIWPSVPLPYPSPAQGPLGKSQPLPGESWPWDDRAGLSQLMSRSEGTEVLTGDGWAFKTINSEKPRHEEDLLLQVVKKKVLVSFLLWKVSWVYPAVCGLMLSPRDSGLWSVSPLGKAALTPGCFSPGVGGKG